MTGQPVRRTLILLAWALLCGGVVAACARHLHLSWEREMASTRAQAEGAVELALQALLRRTDGLNSVLDIARARVEMMLEGNENAVAVLDHRLNTMIDSHRFGLRGIAYVGNDGIVRWSLATDLLGKSIAGREVYRRIILDGEEAAVSAPVASMTSGYWISLRGQRLQLPSGETRGMVVVAFDPLYLGRMLAAVAGRPGRVLLIRHWSDGQIHAVSRDPDGRLSRAAVPDHPVVRAAQAQPQGWLEYPSPTDGRALLTAYRTVGRDFIVQASFNRDSELLAPHLLIARPVIGATLLFILGSLLVALGWERNRRLRRRLEAWASLDPLTGLHNRRSLEQRMRPLLAGAAGEDRRFACLLFDIDHFKSINDRYGHAAGDQVLQEVAQLLRAEVRAGDIICRWGGEEMLVVLADCGREQALQRAEGLRRAIERLYANGQRAVEGVTASVGVACFPGDGATLAAMASVADEAMYRAKREGRNRVAGVELALAA